MKDWEQNTFLNGVVPGGLYLEAVPGVAEAKGGSYFNSFLPEASPSCISVSAEGAGSFSSNFN